MSATLSTIPKLAFSRNMLPVVITSNNYLSVSGVKAINIIDFFDAVAEDQTIVLSWASRQVTMVAASSPDDSGTQFPIGDGSDLYVASLVPYFKANYYLSRDFDIVASGSELLLTGKKTGVDYTFEDWSDASITVSVNTTGVTETIRPKFAILLELWQKAATDINLYSRTLALDYPFTGAVSKNVADIVNSYLNYDIPVLTSAWQACTKSIMCCYLKYAESFGDTPEVQKVNTSADIVFCLGGYSNKALGNISTSDHLEKYLLPDPSLYKFQRWFETFPLDYFEVKTNQPTFLYFMNMRSVAETLEITVVATFQDASTQTIRLAGGAVDPLTKIVVGAGYQQLGLDAISATAGKLISSYTIQITQAGTHEERSLVKSFTVNRNYEEYTRYILYSDSAGNFKTLRTWGKSKLTADVVASTAERFENLNTPLTGNLTRYDVSLQENDELNTGYLVGDQRLDQLTELMLAEKAFRVFGDHLVPIIITATDKFAFEADGENLNGLKITYQIAYKERLYTADGPALSVPRLNQSQQAINDL